MNIAKNNLEHVFLIHLNILCCLIKTIHKLSLRSKVLVTLITNNRLIVYSQNEILECKFFFNVTKLDFENV